MKDRDAKERFERAKSLYADRRYDEAIALLDVLDAQFPETKNIMIPRARCLAKTGRQVEARQVAERAVVLFNDERARRLLLQLNSMGSGSRFADLEDAEPLGDLNEFAAPSAPRPLVNDLARPARSKAPVVFALFAILVIAAGAGVYVYLKQGAPVKTASAPTPPLNDALSRPPLPGPPPGPPPGLPGPPPGVDRPLAEKSLDEMTPEEIMQRARELTPDRRGMGLGNPTDAAPGTFPPPGQPQGFPSTSAPPGGGFPSPPGEGFPPPPPDQGIPAPPFDGGEFEFEGSDFIEDEIVLEDTEPLSALEELQLRLVGTGARIFAWVIIMGLMIPIMWVSIYLTLLTLNVLPGTIGESFLNILLVSFGATLISAIPCIGSLAALYFIHQAYDIGITGILVFICYFATVAFCFGLLLAGVLMLIL